MFKRSLNALKGMFRRAPRAIDVDVSDFYRGPAVSKTPIIGVNSGARATPLSKRELIQSRNARVRAKMDRTRAYRNGFDVDVSDFYTGVKKISNGTTAGLVSSMAGLGSGLLGSQLGQTAIHAAGGALGGALLGGVSDGWEGALGGAIGGGLGGAAYGMFGAPAYKRYQPSRRAAIGLSRYGKRNTGILANGAAKVGGFMNRHKIATNRTISGTAMALSIGSAAMIGSSALSSNEKKR